MSVALDLPFANQCKPAFDEVEPRRQGGRGNVLAFCYPTRWCLINRVCGVPAPMYTFCGPAPPATAM